MRIDIENTNGELLVKPYGRLDSSTSTELDDTLKDNLTAEIKSFTIDMEEVDFISSKGLRVLVSAYRELNGKPMKLLNANTAVNEVLRLSGLLKIFVVE